MRLEDYEQALIFRVLCFLHGTFGALRIARNVFLAMGSFFAARRPWQDDHLMRNFISFTRTSKIHLPRGTFLSVSFRFGRICNFFVIFFTILCGQGDDAQPTYNNLDIQHPGLLVW